MGKKILVVDDDEKILELIKTTLQIEDSDYEIHVARDGKEAVKKAKETIPDLLILDIMMPGMSGYQVCKELKANPETKNAYVLFLSARGGEISEMTVDISGGDDFMTKPFDPKTLGMKVKQALGNS